MPHDPIRLIAIHGRDLLDQAAMQHALVTIEVIGTLCDETPIRNAVADVPEALATIDAAKDEIDEIAEVLRRQTDWGCEASLDAYRRLEIVTDAVGRIVIGRGLLGGWSRMRSTSRSLDRLDRDAVATVEAKTGMFSLHAYFDALHALDPAITPLER